MPVGAVVLQQLLQPIFILHLQALYVVGLILPEQAVRVGPTVQVRLDLRAELLYPLLDPGDVRFNLVSQPFELMKFIGGITSTLICFIFFRLLQNLVKLFHRNFLLLTEIFCEHSFGFIQMFKK